MKKAITKIDNFGRGITYINDKICFVDNSLEGEEVDVDIYKETSKYSLANPISISNHSLDRIEAECPLSSICGGCQCNHMSYQKELNWKIDKVKDIFKRIADIELDNIKINSLNRNHYRNKITLHGNNQKLGYYSKDNKDIIPINNCLISNNKINKLLPVINKNKNLKEVVIKTNNNEKEVMISIEGEVNNIEELKSQSDVLIINKKLLTNKNDIINKIGKYKYYEKIDSFFQINEELTEILYDKVKESLNDTYNNGLDLYCGTGTIGIYISDKIKKIIGVDNNKANIDEAIKNKDLNKINNIDFICNKVENVIDKFKNIDIVIVDPPRSGLDKKTIKYLKEINPKKIIYISCDPITQARDINLLKDNYKLIDLELFNMFPRTYHCESISVLERK